MDLSVEISIPFWDETFSDKINFHEAARLYQINSFFRELVLNLIRRGKVEDLNLYVFGYNRYGQLGLNDNPDRNRPIQNNFFTEKGSIKQIVLGGWNSMILMDNDDVYSTGFGEQGQLGLNNNLNRNIPIRNDFFKEKGSIKQIFLGESHSMILMYNGDLYVFGNNGSGQLGLNDNLCRIDPIRNDFFTDKGSIKQIALRGAHSMVLMNNGDLYVFGYNYYGQLGLNDNVDRNRPIRNDFFKEKGSIKHIILGGHYSMILMDNGDLYVFGDNGHGQLGIAAQTANLDAVDVVGLNDNLSQNRPILNDFFTDKGSIKQIVLGGFHSMILMDNEDLYVFGYNGFGQLGIEAWAANLDAEGFVGRNDFFKEKGSIKRIVLGGSHSMVLMDNGDLYVFGYNRYGQLGLNDYLDRKRPIRNDFFTDKGSIKQIALGEWHSMILIDRKKFVIKGV